ncbi:hypothetical protein VFPPC_15770 [Pochonia chlamydosporia 170]|uniref:Uncharacterized protein n=1 Tax=Pochonia chlamydosporia 170 TaxID=1380566 RepID=A0A179FRP8_METCM|nr:hypothetical protein VFPPC_15770 [Pochonia chlamydosporia 170]OAQ68037.1 hypothetical protein VFPPC_15770 [Pochonia chlamydosporia 170]
MKPPLVLSCSERFLCRVCQNRAGTLPLHSPLCTGSFALVQLVVAVSSHLIAACARRPRNICRKYGVSGRVCY